MTQSSSQTDRSVSTGRRRFLATALTATAASTAGCVSSLRSGSSEPDDAPSSNDTAPDDSTPSTDSGPESDDSRDDPPTIDHPAEIELSDEALLDRRVEPRATGLDAGQRIVLAFHCEQPGDGREWSGRATYEADDDGVVDLASAAPLEGSYEAADPMGPFWSMEPDAAPVAVAFPHETHDVSFEVRSVGDAAVADDDATDADGAPGEGADAETVDGPAVLATATTTRAAPGVETEPLGDDLVGTVHLPDGDEPAPGVLVLHGSGGQELDHVAGLLASRGYVAASLQYFGDPEPIPTNLADVPLEYVQRSIDALAERDRVRAGDVGLYGVSKGGELALVSGAHLDGVGAVASVVGSCYVWEGLTQNWRPARTSSWSLDGEPIDAISFPESVAAGAETIRDTYEHSLEAAEEATVAAATVPVERIDAPCLLVSGGRDEMWPSAPYSEVAVDRLDANDVSFEYEHLQFDDAGHPINPPYVPTYGQSETRYVQFGGTPAGNARAASEHWSAVLDLFAGSLERA